jgi:hypothetical protein
MHIDGAVTDVSDENRQQQVLDYLRERFGRVDEQLSAIRFPASTWRLRRELLLIHQNPPMRSTTPIPG